MPASVAVANLLARKLDSSSPCFAVVSAPPTDSLHQLTEFRVGVQAGERGLASQLDKIRVVFPVRSTAACVSTAVVANPAASQAKEKAMLKHAA